MKKITKTFFIQIPLLLYRISVIVFFGESVEKMVQIGIKQGINSKRFTHDWKGYLQKEMDNNTQGMVVDYGENNKDVLIWVQQKPKKLSEYAILYHELYHAVDHIAHSRNFSFEDKLS